METVILAALITSGLAALAAALTTVVTYKNVTRQLATQREITNYTLRHQTEQNMAALRQQAEQHRALLAHQAEQERLKDKRALRDARRARLRSSYLALLAGVDSLNHRLSQWQQFIERGVAGIASNRDREDLEMPEELKATFDQAQREIHVETDATRVLECFEAAMVSYSGYARQYLGWRFPPGETEKNREIADRLTAEHERFVRLWVELRRAIREDLDQRDQPI